MWTMAQCTISFMEIQSERSCSSAIPTGFRVIMILKKYIFCIYFYGVCYIHFPSILPLSCCSASCHISPRTLVALLTLSLLSPSYPYLDTQRVKHWWTISHCQTDFLFYAGQFNLYSALIYTLFTYVQ